MTEEIRKSLADLTITTIGLQTLQEEWEEIHDKWAKALRKRETIFRQLVLSIESLTEDE